MTHVSLYTIEHTEIGDLNEGNSMKWETPEFEDIRFGFEVTMYINNR